MPGIQLQPTDPSVAARRPAVTRGQALKRVEGLVTDALPRPATVTGKARATYSPTFADRQRSGSPVLEPGHVLTKMCQSTRGGPALPVAAA